MAHFAELDEKNVVKRVLVVNDDYILQNEVEVEQLGIDHLKSVYGEDTIWKQTSYNNNIRVRFGNVGFTYDESLDAFIPPKPYDSWVLNTETCNWEVSPKPYDSWVLNTQKSDWEAPIPEPEPEEGFCYVWNEEELKWDKVEIPPAAPEETPQ